MTDEVSGIKVKVDWEEIDNKNAFVRRLTFVWLSAKSVFTRGFSLRSSCLMMPGLVCAGASKKRLPAEKALN